MSARRREGAGTSPCPDCKRRHVCVRCQAQIDLVEAWQRARAAHEAHRTFRLEPTR